MKGTSDGETKRLERLSYYERILRSFGYRRIAGVDEAGRGPLAGPVVAAAVVLPDSPWLPGLRDSKLLTPLQRERLFEKILSVADAIGTGLAEHDLIDRVNILEATRLAMLKAVRALPVPPDYLLIDALRLPQVHLEQIGIIHGDSLSLSIAAASVVAKVTRDRIMAGYHGRYPQYNFLSHKGYGTREHLERLRALGASPIHRLTFKGVIEA